MSYNSFEQKKPLLIWVPGAQKQSEGAFTPDANEALRANDLHVQSMQRRDRQSCGAIRANEAVQITRRELSVWRAIRTS